jgi:hypothetical protein
MLQDLVALGGHHRSVSLCSYLFYHAQELSRVPVGRAPKFLVEGLP